MAGPIQPLVSSQARLHSCSDFPKTPSRKLRGDRSERFSAPRDSAGCHTGGWRTCAGGLTLRSCLVYPAASRCVGLFFGSALHGKSTVVLAAAGACRLSCIRSKPVFRFPQTSNLNLKLHLASSFPFELISFTWSRLRLLVSGTFQCGIVFVLVSSCA